MACALLVAGPLGGCGCSIEPAPDPNSLDAPAPPRADDEERGDHDRAGEACASGWKRTRCDSKPPSTCLLVVLLATFLCLLATNVWLVVVVLSVSRTSRAGPGDESRRAPE